MRKIVKELEGHRFVIEEFNSFGELIKVNESRKVKPEVTDITREYTKSDEKFMGAKSYEDAKEMLLQGYDKNINTIKEELIKIDKQRGTSTRTTFKNDIVGFAPVVPNAIIGIPQSMIRNVTQAKKDKVITLVVDMAVCGGVTKRQVLSYGTKVVSKILSLEKSGYRVRLQYMKCFNDRRNHGAILVNIKNENQPLNLKRIMFPLTEVAMQRYISWDWYDRVEGLEWTSSRGHSLSVLSRTDNEFKLVEKAVVDNAENKYVICYGNNIDRILQVKGE